MSINAGNTPVQSIPGLKLKAWGFVRTDGVLINGLNVTTARTSTGTYTLSFPTPMTTVNWVCKATDGGTNAPNATSRTAAGCIVTTNGQAQDNNFFFEVYE